MIFIVLFFVMVLDFSEGRCVLLRK